MTEKYVDILNRAEEVLQERGWAQGVFSKPTVNGKPGAVCLAHAINAAAQELNANEVERWDARYAVIGVIGTSSIASWNDNGKRSKPEVFEVLRKAKAAPKTWDNHVGKYAW